MTAFVIIRMLRIRMAGLFILAIVFIGLYITPFIPLSGDSAMVAIGFFYLGTLFRHKNMSLWLSNLNRKICIVSLFVEITLYIVCVHVNDSVNLRTCSYGNFPILFFSTALSGPLIWWQISLGLSKTKTKNELLRKAADFLAYVGCYSMPYLCLNQLVIALAGKLLSRGGYRRANATYNNHTGVLYNNQ